MKKVLFATTALVATAGVAAADVTFGGYGRFGAYYDGSDWSVESRYRLVIDASTESDQGATFGAMVRIQQNENQMNAGDNGRGINDARFYARAGDLEVGVGNIYGAIEWMSGMYVIDLGLTGLGYEYVAYDYGADYYTSAQGAGSGPNAVEVLYSMGDFGVHVSASTINDRRAISGQYAFSDWVFAAAYQDSNSDTDTKYVLSVVGTLSIVDLGLAYADNRDSGNKWVLNGRVDVGAATNVEAYWSNRSDCVACDNGDSYGIDFNHSLGGGVSLRGGVMESVSGDTKADMGVRFNF
jgi:outer membrane protein OmpU